MSQQWNGKALIDWFGVRLWDSSTTFRGYIIDWINEIQNDLVADLPIDHYLFQMKKLLPTEQEIIDLSPQIPSAATAAIASGGSLTEDSSYKVYFTFVLWDADQKKYIESELSEAATEVTATATDKTINLTSIDVYDGTTTIEPQTIWRRVYVAKKASGESSYGEAFYSQDIEDNTATTLSITAEPSSTITAPSYTEVGELSSKHSYFSPGNRFLRREDMNRIKRFDPDSSTSATPSYFDFVGSERIILYPKLSSGATTAQRTLSYYVYRRPHEIFYDVTRPVDLPIDFRKALVEGVDWKAYEFRDRAGKESKAQNYEIYKKQIIRKYKRQKQRPSTIRDVNGDFRGYEV
jgi:hypothetical protein